MANYMTRNKTEKACAICAPVAMTVFIVSILAAGGAFAQGEAPKAQQKAQRPASDPAKTGAPKAARATDNSPSLDLSEYLGQVSDKHQGYKAADQGSRAARLISEESKLIFRPNFTGNAASTTFGQANPFASDSKIHMNTYSLGVNQATNFGLSGQLTYNRSDYKVPAGTLSPVAVDFATGWFQLQLSQSIWRNWAGRELRAQQAASESNALANSYSQSYVTKQLLLEAESNYWRLALARELVAVQKDAVDRAQRIYDWTSRRVRLQLADRAENLQASTNLQAARLNLRTAEDEERAAAQAFNSSRGVDSNTVSEKLVEISPTLIASMTIPARTNTRDDVKVAEMQMKATAANAQLNRERNKPTVELYATLPVTEPDTPPAALSSLSSSSNLPATTVGVRATVPLDFGTLGKAREGYNAQAAAAETTFQRKTFEEQRDWSDLTAKFEQAKERLKLYTELEKTQREKLDYERDRQQRGRSTLQQVLLFEQDYEQAQAGRIRTLAELLGLNAQMKLYGVSYESR